MESKKAHTSLIQYRTRAHSPLRNTSHKTGNGEFPITCRNRHCPKCQGSAATRWLEARQTDLLPVEYYHVVFTLPAPIADIAYHNKTVIYNLLFQTAAQTLLTIAADPKHLGARIGVTMVLHTWGSNLTHHPHVHCIVPGGGISLDGQRWISCKPGFFLPVKVLSRLFRRLFLEQLTSAYQSGQLQFFGQHQDLADPHAFAEFIQPLRKLEWYLYAKPPFQGPKAVLTYLSRYTHRVAIANSRLISQDEHGVTFQYKDYRAKQRFRYKTMTLDTNEFIRRFLIHVLPKGFHRIRHYGLVANTVRNNNLAQARELLRAPRPIMDTDNVNSDPATDQSPATHPTFVCPKCGNPMIVIDIIEQHYPPRAPPQLQT